MSRRRSVDTKSEMQDKTDEYLQDGYKLKSSTEKENIVKEKGVGSLLIHFGLLLFTLGFGNVFYYAIHRTRADAVRIVVEDDSDD